MEDANKKPDPEIKEEQSIGASDVGSADSIGVAAGGSPLTFQSAGAALSDSTESAGGPFIVRKLTIGQVERLIAAGVAFELLPSGEARIPVDTDLSVDLSKPAVQLEPTAFGDILNRAREQLNVLENCVALDRHEEAREAHAAALDALGELRGHFQSS